LHGPRRIDPEPDSSEFQDQAPALKSRLKMKSPRNPFMLSVAVIGLSRIAASGEIVFDYNLAESGFEVSTFEGAEVLSCEGGVVGFEEGLPNLPAISYCFVIPQGTTVTGATFESLSESSLDGFHDILPVRIAIIGEAPGPFLRNPLVYQSDGTFPESQIISTFTGTRTGFRLGSVMFTPFRYNPLSGRLAVVHSARVTLTYETDPSVPSFPLAEEQLENAAGILEHIVLNPADLAPCRPPIHSPADVIVWAAVGSATLQATLQPLVDLRNALGMPAEYVTLDWIYSNYTGYDTQEQIRNYLIDAYMNHGLQYALMVGDWGETQRISSLALGELVLNETTDLYYSDLTRMWDGDGDHLYGENTDWVDYYSDISVGRFSSNNANNVLTQVQKTIEYETVPPEGAWRTSALLCGAGLWPDDGYWGSFVCDSIADRMPPDWTQYKLYETTEGHPANQIDLINAGVSYVSAQGHGNSAGVYWYYEPGNMFTNQNYTGMDNWGMFPVFHSMACNPGQLSVNGCNAERLMMWPYGGAIAVMYNSNYGWGTPPVMGPSEHLEVQFANMMFVFGVQRIGDMQAAAKDAFKAWGSIACQNWVLQENNMLGDPATTFISNQTGIESGQGTAPPSVALGPACPNPAAGSFQVAWSLPCPAAFSIGVYDMSGRLVRAMISAQDSGVSGVMSFDGLDGGGAPLPAGCYVVRLDSEAGTASARVVILEN
jgi:hypothetical protein